MNSTPVTLPLASVTTRTGPAWKIATAPSSIASWISSAAGMSFMSRRYTSVTSAAPCRTDVLVQSMEVKPPPITTTRDPAWPGYSRPSVAVRRSMYVVYSLFDSIGRDSKRASASSRSASSHSGSASASERARRLASSVKVRVRSVGAWRGVRDCRGARATPAGDVGAASSAGVVIRATPPSRASRGG